MAEPHTNQPSDHARGKSEGAPAPAAEQRSFQPPGDGQHARRRDGEASQAEALAQAATRPVIEGGRQIAEHGRRATRQMADVWRQAFDPLLAMQYDLSQMFDDVFRHTFGFRAAPSAHAVRPFAHLSAVSLLGLPPTDLKETDQAYLFAVELPGMARDDVDLSIAGDSLVVCGHKAEENDHASATYRVSERRYGRFERAFPLPPDVDRSRIEARFADGLLRISLPKEATTAPSRSRIEIRG